MASAQQRYFFFEKHWFCHQTPSHGTLNIVPSPSKMYSVENQIAKPNNSNTGKLHEQYVIQQYSHNTHPFFDKFNPLGLVFVT